jgi:hypothetical protein
VIDVDGVLRTLMAWALDNSRRPHSSLDRQTPDQAYFTPLPQIAAA